MCINSWTVKPFDSPTHNTINRNIDSLNSLDRNEIAQVAYMESNTASMSISEEDNYGMVFETCLSGAITSYASIDIIKGCM